MIITYITCYHVIILKTHSKTDICIQSHYIVWYLGDKIEYARCCNKGVSVRRHKGVSVRRQSLWKGVSVKGSLWSSLCEGGSLWPSAMAFWLKVAFCYGLLMWLSLMVFWLKVAFWCGLLLWLSGVDLCYDLQVESGLLLWPSCVMAFCYGLLGDTPQYGWQVDSMHPTGMLSCLYIFIQ